MKQNVHLEENTMEINLNSFKKNLNQMNLNFKKSKRSRMKRNRNLFFEKEFKQGYYTQQFLI